MRSAHAPDTGLRLSKLAFGCAPVMGRIGRSAALRAMETAFDCGVTHFDVARSYGYGDAESVVGTFASGKRDRITIATKFGIRASATARGLGWLKPMARRLARAVPLARSAIRAASGPTLVAGHYRLADARNSFEQSLRQLKTDYADILFIHDCSPSDELSDELLHYLDDLVHIGRIGRWGIATHSGWIAPLFAKLPVQPMVVQCGRDILHAEAQAFSLATSVPAIFHSPFGGNGAIGELRALLAREPRNPSLADLACKAAEPQYAARMLLEGALLLAGQHTVLCSMFDPAHIRKNVEALTRPRFTVAELSALIDVAAEAGKASTRPVGCS